MRSSVRPFACYVGHRAMCTIRFHSIPPLCSHAEWRGEREEGEAAKGTSAKPAPSPSLLSPIESRLARLGARCRNNVLSGCAEYLASKQKQTSRQATHEQSVVRCHLQCRRGAKRRKRTKWTLISPIVKYHGPALHFYRVHL